MSAYRPDPSLFQQLVVGGKTASVDCTAHGGAWCCAAHTVGATILNGRQVRLASNEPIPDPRSPGLNVQQVDDAIRKLTGGRVDFYTPVPGTFGRAGFRDRVIDGRWANLAVKRSVLVDRGYGGSSGFRGAHDITIHARATDLAPIIGDPLVHYYYAATWDAVLDAAQAVTTTGYIFASFTRDLTDDYRVSVHPDTGRFYRYFLNANGSIVSRKWSRTGGFSAACTPPKLHRGEWTKGLVQLTSGSRKGWWINARYAREV